jgi:hypothetical protein
MKNNASLYLFIYLLFMYLVAWKFWSRVTMTIHNLYESLHETCKTYFSVKCFGIIPQGD